MNELQQSLFKLSLKVIIVWMVLSILLLFLGKYVLQVMLPYFALIMNIFVQNYSSTLDIVQINDSWMIQATSIMDRIVYISGYSVAASGQELKASTNLVHTYVPIVLLYTALICWPVSSLKERKVLLILGVPALLIVLGMIVPGLLMSHMQTAFQQAGERAAGRELDTPFIIHWAVFSETGGRWLFPLVAAYLCKLIATKKVR